MKFCLPQTGQSFEIPDEWWHFAEAKSFIRSTPYFLYKRGNPEPCIVEITSIVPPVRTPELQPFQKYKLVPILLSFHSPERVLPPIEVAAMQAGPYKFRVTNGFHRFYASVAVGYTHAPVYVYDDDGSEP